MEKARRRERNGERKRSKSKRERDGDAGRACGVGLCPEYVLRVTKLPA